MLQSSLIDPLFERIEAYGKTGYELLKLRTMSKTADVTSSVISTGIFVLVFCLVVILLSIGLSLWLGEMLGKTYLGFLCMAGLYSILGMIVFIFLRKKIKMRIGNSLISQMSN